MTVTLRKQKPAEGHALPSRTQPNLAEKGLDIMPGTSVAAVSRRSASSRGIRNLIGGNPGIKLAHVTLSGTSFRTIILTWNYIYPRGSLQVFRNNLYAEVVARTIVSG
jgi:hypothetical protein